ncbi:MAG: class I SAM-dependent methyltransferase [Ktedonobacterales bacterium]
MRHEQPSEQASQAAADFLSLNTESLALWEQKAAYWDERMGEGNEFQRLLIAPAAEWLLSIQTDQRVLDVACGNGVFARRLAALGAQVVATDFSPTFIERAKARTENTPEHAAYRDRIDYRVVDATAEADLLALGEGSFDAIYCGMAFMDMVTIDPLLRAARRLLKSQGRFVFSTMHPCFNSAMQRLGVEEEDVTGELQATYYVKVTRYLTPIAQRGGGMPGEPNPHNYFHRPLQDILGSCFREGFVLDGLEEPAFPQADDPRAYVSWANYTEIPPVLVARLRPA